MIEILSGPDVRREFQARITQLKHNHADAGAVILRWLKDTPAPWLQEAATLAMLGQQINKALAHQNPSKQAHADILALPSGDMVVVGTAIPAVAYIRARAALEAGVAGLGLTPADTLCHAYELAVAWEAFMQACRVIYTHTLGQTAREDEAERTHLVAKLDADMDLYTHMLATRPEYPRKLDLLFVEDDTATRQLLNTVLVGMPHVLRFAANGREAIYEYCRKPPHMVFLDIDLPDISGLDVLAIVQRHDARAHAVMLTSHAAAADVQAAKAAGAKGYVVKPFNRQKLAECITIYEKAQAVRHEAG